MLSILPRYLLLAVAIGAVTLLSAQTSVLGGSAPLVVTRTDDPTPDGCQPTDCSLREGIITANETAGGDRLIVPGGTYALNLGGTPEDDAQSGDLDITDALTIEGAGAGVLPGSVNVSGVGQSVLQGDGQGTVLHVGPLHADIAVLIEGLTIHGGMTGVCNVARLILVNTVVSGNTSADPFSAGGIYNSGTLTILGGEVSDNQNTAPDGIGGIWNDGELTMENSLLAGNAASDRGVGGVYDRGKALPPPDQRNSCKGDRESPFESAKTTLNRTMVTENTAGVDGAGGIWSDRSVHVFNSTVSNNAAVGGDSVGGIYSASDIVMRNSTLSGNTGGAVGGLLDDFDGDVQIYNSTITNNSGDVGGIRMGYDVDLQNSIVAGNESPDCKAESGDQFDSLGHNLAGASCELAEDGDITTSNPQLEPLMDNGGPTLTHRLGGSGNQAVNHGSPDDCEPVDQRGLPRVFEGNPACDIGAYELGVPELLWGDNDCSLDVDPRDALLALAFSARLTFGDDECMSLTTKIQLGADGPHAEWGNVNCANSVGILDAITILASIARVPITPPIGCSAVGTPVRIILVAS